MKINTETLLPFLMYNKPIPYSESIVLHPVTMNDIVLFQNLSKAITVRKNSIFRNKKIIKMNYFDFLLYCLDNKELEEEYEINGLSEYYVFVLELLKLCCKDSDISIHKETGQIIINNEIVTSNMFDDLRRIIIIQNDIDFDIDEFMNYDTERKLNEAQKHFDKNDEKSNIEDYIDSLVVAMNTTEERIMNMTIRKFWRYIKRYNLHESYTIKKTGESSGMVSYKEPIRHWMGSLDKEDKYEHLKTDESELRGKVG